MKAVAAIRLVVGRVVTAGGGVVAGLALVREFLSDPFGLRWLRVTDVEQTVFGGSVSSYLLFMAGAALAALGTWIADVSPSD